MKKLGTRNANNFTTIVSHLVTQTKSLVVWWYKTGRNCGTTGPPGKRQHLFSVHRLDPIVKDGVPHSCLVPSAGAPIALQPDIVSSYMDHKASKGVKKGKMFESTRQS